MTAVVHTCRAVSQGNPTSGAAVLQHTVIQVRPEDPVRQRTVRSEVRTDSAVQAQPELARAKALTTIQAQAALHGIVVDVTDEYGPPAWIVRRWSLSRVCASLGQVRALLRRMGVLL